MALTCGQLLGSLEQIYTLTDLGTEPPVLINEAPGPGRPCCDWTQPITDPSPNEWCCCHTQTKPTKTLTHHRGAPERPPAQTNSGYHARSQPRNWQAKSVAYANAVSLIENAEPLLCNRLLPRLLDCGD